MVSIVDKITLFPAFLAFALSAYFAFLTMQLTDLSTKTTLLTYSMTSFIAGTLLIAARIVIWVISMGKRDT
jgi:hypothetical protein